MIRAWVKEGVGALDEDEVRRHMPVPTADSEHARAEWMLAWQLHQRGLEESARPHFERADELAPRDWTIRRGSMPIRGRDPFGPDFFTLAAEGVPVYAMEAITPTREAPLQG